MTEPVRPDPLPAAESSRRSAPEIIGDRPCTACGFNLHGQVIWREPHYGLLIVRCPECSAVTALQEYPSLGRWASRLSRVAAVVFVLFAVGLFVGTSALMGGLASEFGEDTFRILARRIASEHLDFHRRQSSAGPDATAPAGPAVASGPSILVGQLSGREFDPIDPAWWDRADKQAFIAATPGFWESFDREDWLALVGVVLLGLLAGSVWSVLLCAVSRRWIVVFAVGIAALASLMLGSIVFSDGGAWGGWTIALLLARRLVPNLGCWWVLAMEVGALAIGLLVGRSICRTVLRWLILPRHLYLFGWLWTCDQVPLPRPRRVR